MRFILILFLILPLLNCSTGSNKVIGQTISGTFQNPTVQDKYVYISDYFGMDHKKIDSVKLDQNYAFQFKDLELAKGQYRLSLNDTVYKDILVNPNEKAISLNFANTSKKLVESTTVLASQENMLLLEWEKKKIYIRKEIKNINDAIRAKPKNAIDEKQELVTMRDSFRVYEQEFLKFMVDEKAMDGQFFKELYSNYLFPSFEESKKNGNLVKYPDEKAFLKANFFNNLDFGNETLKRTKVFPEMAWYYINNYTSYNEQGFIKSINKILDAAAVDDETKQSLIKFLLKKFHINGPKIVFQYLVENFLLEGACGDGEVDDEVQLMAKIYESLLPGNKAPNLEMKDPNDQLVSIKEVAKKNLGTVLFFWSSHCKYCKEAEPHLRQMYQLNKDKGIEIIGISLDNYKPYWTKAIEDHQLNWINMSDLKAWKSEGVEKFKVHKTPYFYLLSSDMTIISKPRTVQGLIKDVKNLVE